MQKIILNFSAIIGLIFSVSLFAPHVFSQTKPFTFGQVLRAIASINEVPPKVKRLRYDKILRDIRQRKVDFPLTKENEEFLRNEGATVELIEVIRKNSPPLKVQTPTPVSFPAADREKPEVSSNLPNMGGDYSITIEIPGQPLTGRLFLKQQGEVLTGNVKTMFGEDPIKGGKVTPEGFNFKVFAEFQGQGFELSVKGKAAGNSINGIIESAQGAPIPFSGTKNPLTNQLPTTSSLETQLPKPAHLVYLETGNKYFDDFNFDRAIEEYNKVLLIDAQNTTALIQRGYSRHYKGDSNFDFADYNSAVNINPALASEPGMICVLYDTSKDIADNAIENCDKAISAKPDFSLFYYKRANAYRQKNDLDKAIGDYSEAANLYPNFYSAYINRGRVFAAKLDYDKAFADFDKVIAINPKNSSGYFARGQTHRAKKDYGKAFVDFNKILEIEPKNAAAVYLERGFTYQAQNLLVQVENEFNKAIEFDPKSAAAYNARGYLYFTKSKDDQAILDYTKAIELSPKFWTAYFNRAFAYERKKIYDKAIADLDKVIEIAPKFSAAYNNRGLYYFRRGDYNRALEDYNKAVEIEPNIINYRNRAIVYEKLGRKDLAQSDRNSAINTTSRIKITKNKDAATLTSSFAGKVYDKNKNPIYNAQVVITNTNTGFSSITRTDKNGRFVKDGLISGRYKIEISAPGYKTKTVDYPLYATVKVENVNPFILESEGNSVVTPR